ncbi:YbaK/EbsC family protein [Nocardioides sp. ChNu-153]|uniref:aminoacyl-tRNA deacylase n=1 Tax=unclassified Nocardioides TaxID=2615069 RepID=UPI0024061234|nr:MULTISPECIES: YbaK/EbsC family protein [unclassified Nocardioides]MDF9716376.1 YbaK/EbsC family protein [Nocardioides sp. ChNu-99]MDN7122882.1 YbaK/EbsC family protein [Nocardioides sp. ChNu-153]
MSAERAVAAAAALGLEVTVTRHGPVRSLAEAAAARGVSPDRLVKTMVVRRGEDDHLLVLVPGDRVIAWPRLRALLGVTRLSMPPADEALAATGYERGTITPFGARPGPHGPWPVVADERVRGGAVSLGGGEHGVGLTVDAEAMLAALDATVADVTDAAPA